MSEPSSGKVADFTTTIGPDANFKGELSFDSGVRIEGRFEGKLTAKGRLHVGKGAEVKGEVQVGSVLIEGTVRGNIVSMEKIELASTGQVHGDIRTPRLMVAEGATLVGNCNVSADALKPEPGKREGDVPRGKTIEDREVIGSRR
ncbi:MAG: polymer-forming cytoskeletal protein [Planctomycetes bacterium]|nr:polymer-forming cytoskeletal protein [Planctomycetota bacterium]